MVYQKTTSLETAERLITEFTKSGQSRKEFCQKNGIKVGTFHWWMKRHNDANDKCNKNADTATTSFVQITPTKVTPSSIPHESEITIDSASGMRIRWRGVEIPRSFYHLLATLNNGAA